jgi:hypothetical protein
VDLEKDLFITAKKSRHRKNDVGVFLVEFASKLRHAKCAENFSEHLLKYATGCFVRLFMTVYEPLNADLSKLLASTEPLGDDVVDDVLDRAMYLLRSWKNLENDIPGISARNFLNKVELVEKWRFGAKELSQEKGSGMHRVTSTPNLSQAAQSFHRHRSNESFTTTTIEPSEKRAEGKIMLIQ